MKRTFVFSIVLTVLAFCMGCKKEAQAPRPRPIITVSPAGSSFGPNTATVGSDDGADMNLYFNVTAGDKDLYVSFRTDLMQGSFANPVFIPWFNEDPQTLTEFMIVNGGALVSSNYVVTLSAVSLPDQNFHDDYNYRIPAGKTLTLFASFEAFPPCSGTYRAQIFKLAYNTDNSHTTYISYIDGLDDPALSTPTVTIK